MAEYKNKKSFVEEGIREYDYNKRHKRLEKGAGVEKEKKAAAKTAATAKQKESKAANKKK